MHSDGVMNTAMALPGVLCTLSACALVLAGCSSQADPTGSQDDSMRLINTTLAECHDGGSSPPSAYLACQVDEDCVAVPLAGCCHNGWKVAVNRNEVDAYDQANACHERRPICPMYIVNDTRVAECSHATKQCEMVAVDQISCGGFIVDPHRCPSGYECVFRHVPDIPGTCQPSQPNN